MTSGIPQIYTTEDSANPEPFTLELAKNLVADFLTSEPESIFSMAGYTETDTGKASEITGLLQTDPMLGRSEYTGEFLIFGEPAKRRCEIHAVNSLDGPNWVHFAAVDPKQRVFSDHIVAEIILANTGIALDPVTIFDMALFTRFGGSSGSEIQPYSSLLWQDDLMNISFLYPASDPRTNSLKTYQIGFRRFRNVNGKYDAYVRTAGKNEKPRGRKKWLNLALPPMIDPLSGICFAN